MHACIAFEVLSFYWGKKRQTPIFEFSLLGMRRKGETDSMQLLTRSRCKYPISKQGWARARRASWKAPPLPPILKEAQTIPTGITAFWLGKDNALVSGYVVPAFVPEQKYPSIGIYIHHSFNRGLVSSWLYCHWFIDAILNNLSDTLCDILG